MNSKNIYRIFQTTDTEHTFLSAVHGTLSKMDPILDTK
jgi:hypothetical protein